MNFLFVSTESLAGDLALRLIEEKHEVRVYSKEANDQDVYDGFLNRVKTWRPHIEWADVIIFEEEIFGNEAEKLRRQGKYVIGGTKYTDRLEIDRAFGQKELKRHGVEVLPTWKFDDYEKAIDFIRKNPGQYVFKGSGRNQTNEKGLVYISDQKNGEDLFEFLSKNQNFLRRKVPAFILQKYVDGVEIAVGAFFNGKDFIYPINVNFEHKRLFPDNIGPLTGEMGTMMFWSKPNKIFNQTLAKFHDSLAKAGYIGYIDLNCMVDKNGIYPLEFTARFGYPTIQIQLAGITEEAGQWLFKMAAGKNFKLPTLPGFQIGVVVGTPALLSEGTDEQTAELYRDLAISFKGKKVPKEVHIGDVRRDKSGVWRVAGHSGWNLIVTGTGNSVYQAQQKAYGVIEDIKIPNMFYRNDIGSEWRKDRNRLVKWGYLDL